ncbi:peptidoglycan-binding protein [Kitasatospora sp. NPDC036755]|uniref:peptidoglycan-binding domain-containing protein n=1 Tax=Kitasatospora sp. NPDC036755 TaxID=3154600 RepID=UPI00341132F8
MNLVTRGAKFAVALAMAGASVLGVAGSADAAPGAPYLGYGHTTSGTGVWCVQHLVNDWLRLGGRSTIDEDGQWGPKTDGAVRYFQQSILGSAQADGVVGPQTGNKLMNIDWTDPYGGPDGSCRPFIPTTS